METHLQVWAHMIKEKLGLKACMYSVFCIVCLSVQCLEFAENYNNNSNCVCMCLCACVCVLVCVYVCSIKDKQSLCYSVIEQVFTLL